MTMKESSTKVLLLCFGIMFISLTALNAQHIHQDKIVSQGNNAGFCFVDRTQDHRWEWYAIDAKACLTKNGAVGNLLEINPNGELVSIGNNAGFCFADRVNSTNRWVWYSSDGIAYLHKGGVGNLLSITSNGELTITSDLRLKRNIVTIPNALAKVIQLRGVMFEWKDDAISEKHYGVIAQEVEKVIPEVVLTSKEGNKSVAYSKLTTVLIEAVKEQNGTIKTQQEQIDSLNAKVKLLEAKLDQVEALKQEIAELRELIRQSK